MQYETMEMYGFEAIKFTFSERSAVLIKPKCKPNGKWALKTEYLPAFPETEIELLNRGWHIAYNENFNRWAQERDLERKGEFISFVSKTFGLEEKCAVVGMSCGGMYGVKLAAKYPEKISVLYLDAPVMNLLSCPAQMGVAEVGFFDEFYSFTGISKSELLSYRDHPIDKMDILLKADIPVVLVAGDSDKTVPYVENGLLLEKYYKANGGRIKVYIKAGCDHHPHGLSDPTIVADDIENFTR